MAFVDRSGTVIHEDLQAASWAERAVAHVARLAPDTHLYGLGAKALPTDRRGQRLVMWNQDPQVYPPGEDPLYLNIPVVLVCCADQSHGLFYDNPRLAIFDLGKQDSERLAYSAEGDTLQYYFLYGPQPQAVVELYTRLTGRMKMPPLWALGYHQSRWSYFPATRVLEVARAFRSMQIPCDTIHLDIHYMDGYRCFTWDPQRFPDPQGLLDALHADGFRAVVLIDCGIKADPHYAVCAKGLERGFFCQYPDGRVAGGPVWPGESYFPDFSSPEVRAWWGDLHKPLLDAGVDGIWNDMNEPTVQGPGPDTLAGCVRHDAEGVGADHSELHNVYGLLMARATAEGLQRLRSAARPFVITRSGWAGVQRHATSWTGDNQSTWDHLRLTVPMVLGLGLSGLSFVGPDIGGFAGDCDAELLVRWMQMGAFLPLFRNHSAWGTRDQEPWAFGEPYLSHNRAAIELRYRLLPYLYTAVWQSTQTGVPIARPLFFEACNEPTAHTIDDQFLCGDTLLVAPIVQAGADSRQVYLPKGRWYDYWTDRSYEGPLRLSVAAPLHRIPPFVRGGSVLPTWPLMQHTGQAPPDRLILHVYPGQNESWLYQDDGHSLAHEAGAFRLTGFDCNAATPTGAAITCHGQGDFASPTRGWEWHIHGLSQRPEAVCANGQALPAQYDAERQLLTFKTAPEPDLRWS